MLMPNCVTADSRISEGKGRYGKGGKGANSRKNLVRTDGRTPRSNPNRRDLSHEGHSLHGHHEQGGPGGYAKVYLPFIT